jgi:MFS family permease
MLSLPASFLALWSAQFISIIGSEVTRFALSVWLFQTYSSATMLGLALACGFAPQVLLGPVVGALIDSTDRKKLLIACDLGLAVVTTALIFTVDPSRPPSPWLWLALLAHGSISALQNPAIQATTGLLNSAEDLHKANGLMAMADSSAATISPLLAVSLMAVGGIRGALLTDVATFIASALIIGLLLKTGTSASSSRGRTLSSYWTMTREGFRTIVDDPGLFRFLVATTVFNFAFSSALSLFVPLVLIIPGSGPDVLAVVASLPGLVQIGLSAAFSALPHRKPDPLEVIGGTAVIALAGLLPIALSRGLIGLGVAYIFCIGSLPVINAVNRSFWQAYVPGELHGRVFAIRRTISTALNPLGYAVAGPFAEKILIPSLGISKEAAYRGYFLIAALIIAVSSASAVTDARVRSMRNKV